jgi:hypothetical protein
MNSIMKGFMELQQILLNSQMSPYSLYNISIAQPSPLSRERWGVSLADGKGLR